MTIKESIANVLIGLVVPLFGVMIAVGMVLMYIFIGVVIIIDAVSGGSLIKTSKANLRGKAEKY